MKSVRGMRLLRTYSGDVGPGFASLGRTSTLADVSGVHQTHLLRRLLVAVAVILGCCGDENVSQLL